MNNEIKVGDKVRVSKDAQKVFAYGLNPLWFTDESTVVDICTFRNEATIKFAPDNYMTTGLHIPTKYLVKVEEEPKFRVGDKVRVKPDAKRYHDGSDCAKHYCWLSERDQYLGKVGTVVQVESTGEILLDLACHTYWEPIDLESCEEAAEEQVEAERIRQMEAERELFFKEELDRIGHPEKYVTYEFEVNNSFINWAQYEAELAKEVAVKIVNKNMDSSPEDVGKYAVCLAKGIVEELKKK